MLYGMGLLLHPILGGYCFMAISPIPKSSQYAKLKISNNRSNRSGCLKA